jgi:hypothetical protein
VPQSASLIVPYKAKHREEMAALKSAKPKLVVEGRLLDLGMLTFDVSGVLIVLTAVCSLCGV